VRTSENGREGERGRERERRRGKETEGGGREREEGGGGGSARVCLGTGRVGNYSALSSCERQPEGNRHQMPKVLSLNSWSSN
jgi:hypothetical protein